MATWQLLRSHGMAHEICDRLVVAVNDEEISRLKKLLERGQQHYLRWLSATRS